MTDQSTEMCQRLCCPVNGPHSQVDHEDGGA